ncbi:MAG TPA: CDP-alcohol phosphatidyltransferase family protein [Kofleriaceae bacterium]|nr:CDP-alcohol phosphatidyltransferase family protein [Kofleriaceae bacterium]
MWLAHGLTLSRIPIAVVFWLTYGDRWLSLSLVVLAALTDALDGNVARWVKRRTGNTSTLGEWLDPVADKLFIILVLGAIQVHDPVPWLLLAMICARELVLIPLAMIYRLVVHGRGQHAFQAQGLGKAATIAELAAIVAIILRSPAVMPIAVAAAVLGLAAVAVYISRAAHRHEKVAA